MSEEEKSKVPYMSLTINIEYGEDEELKRILKAKDLCSFIWDFQQRFKEQLNHIEYEMDKVEKDSVEMKCLEAKYQEVEAMQITWYNELNDKNISLDELWS